jgi:hypothetical protein
VLQPGPRRSSAGTAVDDIVLFDRSKGVQDSST